VYRYERTTQSPVPTIISHQPTFIDLSQCDSGCQLVFDVETPGDYSQIASVGLEREVGDAWVQETQLWGPLESPTWQLQRTFHADDAPGAYVFRVVTRLADGARAVSAEVTVSVENGPTPTVFSRVVSTYRDGTALIRWDATSTASVRGFNVYRRREGERHFGTVNEQLIPPGERVFTDAGVTPGSRYVYQVGAVADDGEWLSEAARLSIPEVMLMLEQNHPNPFNPSTAIAFSMPAAGSARLSIFDVRGALVTVLFDGPAPLGRIEITWDGRDSAGVPVGSGLYFCRLDALKHALTRRMVLLK
jgi:hypothetical protein